MDNTKKSFCSHDIMLLRAYLEQVVSIENKCRDDFSYTEWYLQGKYTKEEVTEIIKHFELHGAKCDCDLMKKCN